MASLFTKIVNGEIPCHKIAEDHNFLAFLDIAPLAKGHTLVIPKKEVDYYFDLSVEEIAAINVFAKMVSQKVEAAIPCERIGVAIIGLEVPHAHIHLIPLNSVEDINFSRPKLDISQEELSEIAKKIRQA